MNAKETLNKGLKRSYNLTVPFAQVEEFAQNKLVEVQKTASIKGFRPGKVPANLLEQRYGEEVRAEATEALIKESANKFLQDKKFNLAAQPHIELAKEPKEGADIEYSISFELFPEMPEIDFAKIKLEKLKVEVTEKDVEERIAELSKDAKDFAPVKDRKQKTVNGNTVVIDFLGKVDGVAFDGGKAEDYKLELGSKSFIGNFEEQLEGLTIGDKKLVKVSFPAEYGSKDLAGKAAEFDIVLKEIMEPAESKVDDEFAKKFGLKDLKELQEKVKESIEQSFDKGARDVLKKNLFDHFEKNTPKELPETLVESELKGLLDNHQHQHEKGECTEDHKDLEKDFEKIATRRVGVGLMLSNIGQVNEIKVTDKELIANAEKMYPGYSAQMLEYYKTNPQAAEQAKGMLFEDKVVDFIITKISLKDKLVSSKEFSKLAEKEFKNN